MTTNAQTACDTPITANVVPDTAFICMGDSVDLTAEAMGGDSSVYMYDWSTGDTTQTIRVGAGGTYTVTVTDTCVNSATAEGLVEMYSGGQISCEGHQNVSVDENCEAVITPGMMLTGTYSCMDDFTVKVEDDQWNTIGQGPTVTVPGTYVGETLYVTVYNQDQSNQCWGEVTIEDKMGPTITCSDTTVVCYRLDSIDTEDVVQGEDNCSNNLEIVKINEEIESFFPNCESDTIKRVRRVYVAYDGNGGVSQPCTVNVSVLQIDPEEIICPPDDTVYCNGQAFLPSGAPHPDSTGVPTVGGRDIDDPHLEIHCNYDVDRMDIEEFNSGCKRVYTRIWTIQGVCLNTMCEQQITVIDTSGPEIACPDIPDTLSTNMFQCTGTFFIPTAEAEDDCNGVKHIDLSIESEWNAPPIDFMPDFQGGMIQLPAGPSVLTYTAYDECHNSSRCTDTIYVLDQNQPVPICDQHTVVSLNQEGEARVYANTFDDGSIDDCMLDSFAVARMDGGQDPDPEDFGSYVEFNCADQADEPLMVVFRVYDMAGNFNDCMVEVDLQDKIGASMQCPPDITLSCQYPVDTDNLSEFGTVHAISDLSVLTDPQSDPRQDIIINDPEGESPQPRNWGQDGFAYDNCGITNLDVSVSVDSQSQCGEYTISRTFTAMGPGGPVAECTQTISVVRTNPFNESNITWPGDVTVTGSCAPDNLTPDAIEAISPGDGSPDVVEDECDIVLIHHSDWQFDLIPGQQAQACYKLIRKWEIIDWCQYNSSTDEGIWEYDQVIKIENTVGPTFHSAARDTSFCSGSQCEDIPFSLSKGATDDCTPNGELQWSYFIDENSDGSVDHQGNDNSFSGTFPTGTHEVQWVVEDRCGNSATQTETFELSSCKGPTAFCQDINAELNQMVINGDTMVMTVVDVDMIDAGSHAACPGPLTLTFDPTGAQKDTVIFTCNDLGSQPVSLYVFDSNGNSDECVGMVNVQDNSGDCNNGSGSSTGVVGGHIQTQADKDMPEVQISFNGTGMDNVMTNTDGNYTFPAMSTGGENYEVIPSHDKEPLNGVSTYDLVLIQKHILGTSELIDPYKQIAADVNASGNISAADMVELRQLILGIYDEYQYNESWRFVDKYYSFKTDNAASEDFPESYFIDQFTGDMTNIDFIGVKIGDINNSVSMEGFGSIEDRTGEHLTFEFADRSYAAGEDVSIPVYPGTFDQLLGYQFTLDFDEQTLLYTGIESGTLPVDENYIGFPAGYEGVITMSWNDVEPLDVEEGKPLFTLQFKAVQEGVIHEAFEINSEVTQAEGYASESEIRPVDLGFRGERIAGDVFELHQNIPNPFDQTTRIGFNLPEATDATLTVFDVTGKVMAKKQGQYSKGYNEIALNKSELSAEGVMYYQLSTGKYTATKKMIMVE